MNEPQLFNFKGQQVRTVTINNEPYFVGKDVAMNLKYRQPADAIRNHVQPEDKGVYKLSTPGGEQRMTVINHSDGHTTVNITTKVTGKGQQYFINKFLNAPVIEA